MRNYSYRAYSRDGRDVVGDEYAESPQKLKEALLSRGLLVRSVSRRFNADGGVIKASVSNSDFLDFVGELIALLESGMGIPEALSLLADDDSDGKVTVLGGYLQQVLVLVKSGQSFSLSCEQFPSVFDSFFVSTLKMAEHSGEMVKLLRSYHKHLERTNALRQKMSQALTYPIFLFVTFSVILLLMFAFVVPNFVDMYANMSTDLPLLTVWLMLGVDYFPYALALFSVLALVGFALLRKVNQHPEGRVRLDKVKGQAPIAGGFYRLFTYWQFTQSLSALLRGGATVLYAVRAAQAGINNRYFARQLAGVIERIISGESLSAALGGETFYPGRAIKMISVGEDASNLVAMLDSVAGYFDRQLDDKIVRITSLIEPIVMLLIGLVIGVVIVALYLPVLGMVNAIG